MDSNPQYQETRQAFSQGFERGGFDWVNEQQKGSKLGVVQALELWHVSQGEMAVMTARGTWNR